MHALVRPRSGTNITVFVMGVCVRVRVARVVRVSEGTLPTIVNTLRSSKEPLGTIRRNPNYPPPGLPARPMMCPVPAGHKIGVSPLNIVRYAAPKLRLHRF
jgi:hypothetical protein